MLKPIWTVSVDFLQLIDHMLAHCWQLACVPGSWHVEYNAPDQLLFTHVCCLDMYAVFSSVLPYLD